MNALINYMFQPENLYDLLAATGVTYFGLLCLINATIRLMTEQADHGNN